MKWKFIFLLVTGIFVSNLVFAQLNVQEKKALNKAQDSLKELSYKMINDYTHEGQLQAVNQFIPGFVNALKIKHSFSFPFDSLNEISILYDKEHTFRIFTWAIALSDYKYRFYGAIQKKTEDGSLKLFSLFDNTYFNKDKDTITGSKGWLGALYYKIIEKKYNNKKLYTLVGWAGKDLNTNEKVIDVLTFKNGQPVFGAPVFNFSKDSVSRGIQNRFFLKYKRDGNASMNYDKNLDMIIYDHLISYNEHPKDTSTFVPDGTYSGFKWENGNWMHIEKVFHQTNKEAPVPQPFKFNKTIEGNKNKKEK